MDNKRIFLYAALGIVIFLLWSAWQKDHPQTIAASPTTQTVITNNNNLSSNVTVNAVADSSPTANTTSDNRIIHVHTNVLNVDIDLLDGTIVSTSLPKYPQQLHSSQPFVLMNNEPENLYIAQSTMLGIDNKQPNVIQGKLLFQSPQSDYTLQSGTKNLQVILYWKNAQGLTINKIFTFTNNKYAVDVSYQIINHSKTPWSGRNLLAIQRMNNSPKTYLGMRSFFGFAISTPDKPYQGISLNKLAEEPINTQVTGGWLAMVQHYFLSAWVPDPAQTYNFYSQVDSINPNLYTVGAISPPIQVMPGQTTTVSAKLYSGPIIAEYLNEIAPHLSLAIDYGWLWILSNGIFWLMKHIYNIVGNWGWSIVLVTLLIKLALYRLSAISYISMANMRKLQPKLAALKDKYSEDKQGFSRATMELYRKEKVNPLGGCLPMIVQIPIFIGLYYVILESVQLRQAPFIFWIHDLSVKDPYYVLPILMGLSMLLQQKMSPPLPDPTQAKMMMFLPLFFMVLFSQFPAGLVLYWVVNNLLSLLQQWYITKKFERGGFKKKTAKKNKK